MQHRMWRLDWRQEGYFCAVAAKMGLLPKRWRRVVEFGRKHLLLVAGVICFITNYGIPGGGYESYGPCDGSAIQCCLGVASTVK